MSELMQRMQLGANDHKEMVIITLGRLKPRIPYRAAFAIAQNMRMACKHAMRLDGVSPKFTREFDSELVDLEDCPPTHFEPRWSKLVPNVHEYEVKFNIGTVILRFDDVETELPVKEAMKLHHEIRRAGRRAKAWAGDSSPRNRRMMGMLTDAEEDDRLGVA